MGFAGSLHILVTWHWQVADAIKMGGRIHT